MSNTRDFADEAAGLRRFGLALVRDDRWVRDESSAARLVDKLIRQSSVASIAHSLGARAEGRVGAYARFVQLYRRHVRRMAVEEEAAWTEAGGRSPSVLGGLRALPLEAREALLLVALARFSHREAAEALDIPLARLVERLERSRGRLAQHMCVDVEATANAPWPNVAHLRIVK